VPAEEVKLFERERYGERGDFLVFLTGPEAASCSASEGEVAIVKLKGVR
jgi:hypothetical protein